MAPTSKERREVAERMRGPFDVCECAGHTYINGTLYGMQVCARDELALRNGMRRLADLIDPATSTTTFTLDEHSKDGEEVYPTRWWKCARCGEETIMMYDEGEPVACPYCGAKVADDGVRGDAL